MKEQRSDVTALPYGTSVGHMFIVTYLVIGPVYWKTKDPILAWQIGLSWCFLESLTQVIVSFIVIKVRSITPRAAMLGTMAGLSLTLIAMKPMAQVWKNPITAFAGFALALVDFFGRKRLLGNFPAASATDR